MKWNEIVNMIVPLLAAAIGWLIGQIISIDNRLTKIESSMPVLIAPDGTINDSPASAKERMQIREDLNKEITDLKIRLSVIEEAK